MICATVAYCISTKPAGESAALYYGSGCLPPVRPWCSWIGWRTSEILENVLGEGYEGWLMSDGYNAYRRFLKRCRCWAHLLRKAQGLVECLDSEAQHFGRQTVDVLDTLMAAIRTARDDPPDTGLSRLYGDLLENYRLECERMSLFTHTKARALAVEMLNDWAAIFRVLDHPHLPADQQRSGTCAAPLGNSA